MSHESAAEYLESCKKEIVASALDEARRRGNRVALDPGARRLFTEHIVTCIDGVCAELRGEPGAGADRENALSRSIGRLRAAEGLGLDESKAASLIFFEVATGILLARLEDRERWPILVAPVLSALNRTVVERIMTATAGYLDYLISGIQTTHVEERLRVSREIHDRVASWVSASHRGLELYALSGCGGRTDGAERLQAARSAFTESLTALEEISGDLVLPRDEDSLHALVNHYLEVLGPIRPTVTAVLHGDESAIPYRIRAELFLIIREALRNALRHAGATAVTIEVGAHPDTVVCSITDDGSGFRPDTVESSTGRTGLLSMRERAHSVGGDLAVDSRPGGGTRILVSAPLSTGMAD
ncbi:sensor histidine kinase [Actinocorallia longicatena]|uniref:histidine kinase n=1 Tax=Actinocorallia longicatena TaxID=111803 RepID=A0ABP6PV60_9ACTN